MKVHHRTRLVDEPSLLLVTLADEASCQFRIELGRLDEAVPVGVHVDEHG